MGVFTQVEINVYFDDINKADSFVAMIDDFQNEVTKRRLAQGIDEPFSSNIDGVDLEADSNDGAVVYIKLSSQRYSNAEFQATWVSNIAKEFKENITEFNADVIQPETILYWRGDEDGEFEPDEE